MREPRIAQMANFGFRVIPRTPLAKDQLPLVGGSEVAYGVAIAPDSEIDCCWLVTADGGSTGGIEGPGGAFANAGGNAPPRATYKLCKGAPFIGRFQGPLLASPYYGYFPAGGLNDPDFAFAKLSLQVWTDATGFPPPIPTVGRAPLRTGWHNKIISTGAKVMIPLYGRRILTAFAAPQTANAVTLTVDYIWYDENGVETLQPSTGMGVPATSGLSALKTGTLPDYILFQGDAVNATDLLVEAED